jgi:DNA repair protein SbcC/Rad50
MKLKLKNFRCYLEKEFDFGLDGLLLLSGASGSGKSTVLMAITFVLYGNGNKLTTFGKTSCQVEMDFDELNITRTKRPNRLVVVNTKTNEEFEDDAAQGIINERFGTAFEVTSYVQQNAVNSFIMMSPLEKLAFLEKFAFHGVDLSQLKGRCQSIIKKRNEELISITSQLEMASDYCKTLVRPEKVHFPIKTNNRQNAMKNEVTRLKNSRILIKKAEKHSQYLTEELADTRVYTTQVINKNEIAESLHEKIDQLELDKKTTHYEGDEKLEQYETDLKLFLSRKELLVLQDRYDEDKVRLETMQENEKKEIRKEIEIIEASLWKEYNSDEVTKTISEYQQLIRDAEKLERLNELKNKHHVNKEKLKENKETLSKAKEELSEKKELLGKLILQQESYECPSCHVSLRFQDSELHLFEDDIPETENSIDNVKKEITQLSRTVNKLEYLVPEEENKLKRYIEIVADIASIEGQYEEEIPSKDEAESTIEYMKEYKRTQGELDKRRKKLESNIKDKVFSSSLELFKEQLAKQKETIKDIEKGLKKEKPITDVEEEELRHVIQIQKQNKEKMSGYDKQIKSLSKELKIVTESLTEIKDKFASKYTQIREAVIVEAEISAKTEEIRMLKLKAVIHEQNVNKIEEYNKYKEELGRYTEWTKKIQDFTESEAKARKRYSAATLLKDKILEAESLAILNVISSINVHAQEYLDIFFPIDPIVVRLLPFKTTKKKTSKPQVNLEVDYKGMEADISMLSGGELARVVLAYTLALAEIFNSPMIMLDESTASLDQDMTSIVMEGIRKNFGNKLTIIIAHQVISGDFDRQISL